MSLKVFTAAVGALALTALVGYAQAQPGPAAPARRAARTLNLTDAQRDQMAQLREEHRKVIRDQAIAVSDAERALHAEIFADNPDQAKIESLKTQVADLHQQLRAQRIDLEEKISRILTPEQRKLMRDRGIRMRGWRGDGMGRGLRMRGPRAGGPCPWCDWQ